MNWIQSHLVGQLLNSIHDVRTHAHKIKKKNQQNCNYANVFPNSEVRESKCDGRELSGVTCQREIWCYYSSYADEEMLRGSTDLYLGLLGLIGPEADVTMVLRSVGKVGT